MTASPTTLRAAAGELRRVAHEVETLFDPVATRMGPDVWAGAAADRFAHELGRRRQAMQMTALELKAAARRLDARAAATEAASPINP